MANPPSQRCQGGGGTGTRYTYAQLMGLWINAGGPRDKAALMAAIALAESGGCSAALNSIRACGLWQIHPYQNGCLDAATNAKMAVAKYQGQGLTAWTTYTSGAYKAFLSPGTTPDLNVPSSQSLEQSGGGAAAGTCLVAIPSIGVGPVSLAGGGCAISKTQARAFLGGTLMAGGGLVMLFGLAVLAAYGLKSSGAGKSAGGALEAVGAGVALIPGAEAAGAATALAGNRIKAAGTAGAAQRATDRATRRQASAQRAAAAGRPQPQPAAATGTP